MSNQNALAKDVEAKPERRPEHAHLWAIVDKSHDPHARKAAQEHINRLSKAADAQK
jgi:hypothetical protein